MSRLTGALLGAMLWATAASAQMLPGGAAPPVHPGTKLNFPPTLAGAQFERSFTTPIGRDVLYGYQYVLDKLQINVFLFDGGRRIPSGSDSPAVVEQFSRELEGSEKALKQDGFTGFEKPAVPSTCTYGTISFRCIVYSATSEHDRIFSKLLMTGYHDYFVKIRVDWSLGSGQVTANADRALQAFIPALMH